MADVVAAVDLGVVAEWMDGHDLGSGEITRAEVLGGGTQNVLLRFERDGRAYVLRRPPEHKRRNSDETMRREATVLAALADTEVPHPRLIAAEPSTEVIGAAFYLMEPIDGFNASVELPAPHRDDPAIRHRMGLAMAEGAAALGAVDHESVGLADFGKPEGWLERQVERWQSHLDGYREFAEYPGPDIPGLDEVADWLTRNRPRQWSPGITHGDYHLANVLFSPDDGELAAIVDWELCTIGDPLLDLGWLLATWPEPGLPGGTVMIDPWEGFPTRGELIAHYGEHSERSVDEADWYGVLACYKLGIILEGTHARAFAGKAPTDIGDLLHATTVGLFERAQATISGA
jgi:aminoglycoside phosphotransferase (APT) family kinase protein